MLGLVVRVAVAVAVLGVAMNDGGQILRAQVRAQSAARAAAAEASNVFSATHSRPRAEAQAVDAAAATDRAARVGDIRYEPDGSVTVTVSERARTLVAQHVSFLKRFTVQRASERESPTR